MYYERIVSRSTINNKERKKTKNTITTLVIVLSTLLVVLLFSLLVYSIQPLEIRKIEYDSNDVSLVSQTKKIMEEYVGTGGEEYLFENNSIGGILALRLTSLENMLSFEIPEYKNFVVKMNLKGVVTISAEPRTDFIYFCYGDEIIKTDSDGFAIKLLEKNDILPKTIVVDGVSVSSCTLGRKIEMENSISWKTIAELYFTTLANESLENNISKIAFVSEDDIYLYCENNIVVKLGSASSEDVMFSKLKRLASIFNIGNDFNDGTIYLSDDGVDTFRPNKEGSQEEKIEIEH